MTLNQKIVRARKQMGLTQEEVASAANVTVRTIQRIESGDSVPRKFTLKLIASALNIPFDELNEPEETTIEEIKPITTATAVNQEDDIHFLRLVCLSCFSYLLIPYVHFLIPSYLLKKRSEPNPAVTRFARQVIQNQIYWVIATVITFLLTMCYNFLQAAYLNKQYPVNYLFVFFLMYFANAAIIANSFMHIKKAIYA
jgi:transcriptional regulator with XRE-family HTH domain